MQTGAAEPDGEVTFRKDGDEHTVRYASCSDNTPWRGFPRPSPGDIFFDFEGDPLWQDEATGIWGLEYLFGVVEAPAGRGGPGAFSPFWAHSRARRTKQALLDFLDYVEERRRATPDMHVYHYAAYEKTALRKLSVLHVAGEDTVDEWLREGCSWTSTTRSGTASGSRKTPTASRSSSRCTWATTCAPATSRTPAPPWWPTRILRCRGMQAATPRSRHAILAAISDYNEYDCLSTLELRNWLLRLAAERGVVPGRAAAPLRPCSAGPGADGGGPLRRRNSGCWTSWRQLAEAAAGRSQALSDDDEQAVAMVAAAVGLPPAGAKQFWWAHFDRLRCPGSTHWADDRNVFLGRSRRGGGRLGEAELAAATRSRVLALTGTAELPVPTFKRRQPAGAACTISRFPAAGGTATDGSTDRASASAPRCLELGADAARTPLHHQGAVAARRSARTHEFPVALTEDQPVATTSHRAALADLAAAVAGTAVPRFPATRRGPAPPAPAAAGRRWPAARSPSDAPGRLRRRHHRAVADLDDSYLAVQGPPGTGKTYVGSHVIARLVARGWKVGVVGQSHAVVENMLCTAIEKAGVDPAAGGQEA